MKKIFFLLIVMMLTVFFFFFSTFAQDNFTPLNSVYKTNATLEDYFGEWILNAIKGNGFYISTSGDTITINESTLTLIKDHITIGDIPYQFENGMISTTAAIRNKDGIPYILTVEYHDDNSIFVSEIYDDTTEYSKFYYIFVHEEDLNTERNLDDIFSIAYGAIALQDIELSGSVSLDVSTYVLQMTNDPEFQKQLSQIDELLNNANVQLFLAGFRDENGGYSYESVMKGLETLLDDEDMEKFDLIPLRDTIARLFGRLY